ncbi:hypothetical protein B0T12DRAFT_421281 [Alternaria alternata]|nr:hypothetical protein B0T12DRAFT_421281 [Alternaria alternata]
MFTLTTRFLAICLTPLYRPAVAERSGTSESRSQIMHAAFERVSFSQLILEVHAPPLFAQSSFCHHRFPDIHSAPVLHAKSTSV